MASKMPSYVQRSVHNGARTLDHRRACDYTLDSKHSLDHWRACDIHTLDNKHSGARSDSSLVISSFNAAATDV